MEAGAFTAQGGIGNLPQQPMPEAHRLEREYIWGPGDSFAGVDELFVLFDREREPWLVLQDASGDVAALCGRTSISQPAYVAAQWTWDAYGNVFSADHIFDHPFISVGHKGLFVERLDVGVADASVPGSQYADTPRIVPFGHLIYHNRNRTYNPQQGRFLQLDMNASGVALMEAAAFNGRGMGALAVAFDMQTRYGDGANLYQYLGSSPWQRFDPMGLSYDPFDMVDEIVNERIGSASALLQSMGQHAQSIAVVSAHILSYLPFPAASLAGELALAALGEQTEEAALAAAAIGLIPGGKLMGLVGKIMGGVGSAAWGAAKHYAARDGAFLANKVDGLFARAKSWLRKGCGCFTAETKVWTMSGLVAISQIVPGDFVVALDESTGAVELRMVTEVMVREIEAPLVLVHLADGEMIETTEEHPFLVSGVWVRADQLRPGNVLDGAAGEVMVQAIQHTNRLATVHNLEVDGLHNYRVGESGVVVHNSACKLRVEQSLPTHQLKYRPIETGKPPFGVDGKVVMLHHPDPADPMRVREMLTSDHVGKGNKAANHPEPWVGMSSADRSAYNAERKKYWEEMWNAGRFSNLPKQP
jgi:hypothetical protein